MKYREDMTPGEQIQLAKEIALLDAAYADADELAQRNRVFNETVDAIIDGIIEQSLDTFNRYIAGDRR